MSKKSSKKKSEKLVSFPINRKLFSKKIKRLMDADGKMGKILFGVIGGLIVLLLSTVILFANDKALGKALFGSNELIKTHGPPSDDKRPVNDRSSEATSSAENISSTPSPQITPEPSFSPVPLAPVPEDDLQSRKEEFQKKAAEFTKRAKEEGVSNTAIANTIRLMYQTEFGTNADSQQQYSNCLTNYNTKLSEYNACMLEGNYGCYKPVNTCIKPIDGGL